MKKLSLVSFAVLSLALVASCSKTDPGTENSCTEQPTPICLTSFDDGRCGDVAYNAVCSDSGWKCPTDTIPASECRCSGIPPLADGGPMAACVCGDAGWVCSSDGGAGAGGAGGRGGSGGGCAGAPNFNCAGGANGVCGDVVYNPVCVSEHWACGSGQIPVSECRCFGSPQTCLDGGAAGSGAGAGGRGGGGGRGGTGGVVDGGSACAADARFSCAAGSPLSCSDAFQSAACVSGQWQCPGGTIPTSQCICVGAPPPGCSCGVNGWSCSGGTGGRGGSGGAGGRGGSGGASGGTGGGAAIACGNSTCTGGNICLRRQTFGGACILADGGCPSGSTPSGFCCVPDPTYSCVALPAACDGKLTCDCARASLCSNTTTCTATDTEIACALLLP